MENQEARQAVAKRLRKLRILHDLTTIEVGERLGCLSSRVSKYETAVRLPNLEDGHKLAELYGVPFERLFEGVTLRPRAERQAAPQDEPPGEDYRQEVRRVLREALEESLQTANFRLAFQRAVGDFPTAAKLREIVREEAGAGYKGLADRLARVERLLETLLGELGYKAA